MRLPKRVDHRVAAGRAAIWRRRCATPGSSAAGPRRRQPRAAPPTTRSWRRCAGRCARTRATAATTARRTPAGPSATAGWPRETEPLRAEGARHHALAGPGVRPDPRAARRARLPGPDEDAVTDDGPAAGPALGRVRPAGRRVPAARTCGTASNPPSWRPSCRRWSTSRAGTTHRTAAAVRRGRPTPWQRTVRLWAELEADERRHKVERTRAAGPGVRVADAPLGPGRVAGRGADGRRAATGTSCPPATSCAGAAR